MMQIIYRTLSCLNKDGEGKTDGSILIYDKAGETLAALDIPWAKDANGKDVC